jgi:hypothetical protein
VDGNSIGIGQGLKNFRNWVKGVGQRCRKDVKSRMKPVGICRNHRGHNGLWFYMASGKTRLSVCLAICLSVCLDGDIWVESKISIQFLV